MLKPPAGEGYFDDVFAIDADGKRIALIRTDAATFSKLELFDVASGKPLGGFALPSEGLFPVEMELLAGNAGVVIVGREKHDDLAPLYAFRFDGAGKPAGKIGPATAFGRPPADGTGRARLLVAFTRKLGTKGAEATFTVAPYDVTTMAPAGKPRVHKVDVTRRAEAARGALHRLLRRLHARVGRTPGRLRQEGRRAPAVQDGDHRRHQRQGGEGRADRRHRGLGADRTAQAAAPRAVGVRRAQ